MDEEKSDKLIARLRKGDAGKVSFSVSNDYKYLILSGIRMVCIANIENLDQKLKFKLIFEKSQNAVYVSAANNVLLFLRNFLISRVCRKWWRFFQYQDYVGNDGDFFIFLTNVEAPKHRLIEVDIRNKISKNYVDVIVPVSNHLQKSK